MTEPNAAERLDLKFAERPRLQHFPDCDCVSNIDHPSHAKQGIHVFPDRLHVVTMVENPLRWRSRYNNFDAFEAMVEASSAVPYVVEVAFGDRHFEVTSPNNPRHLQLRTYQELWHKENALNLLIERLPKEANYIAWLDADVQFTRRDWAQETLHLLQHYKFLQMFSHAHDLDSDCAPIGGAGVEGASTSYIYNYYERMSRPSDASFKDKPVGHIPRSKQAFVNGYYPPAARGRGPWVHPGYAWAARKSALNEIGGLIDFAILGSGDWHLATCLLEEAERSIYSGYSDGYKRRVLEVEWKCKKYIRRNVGYMPGLVTHLYHGSKENRNYGNRWKFLALAQYDPGLDLKRDHQGLYQLEDRGDERSISLREGIRAYNRMRNEDRPSGTE